MTNRELATKLCELACQLEQLTGDNEEVTYRISKELHELSNERYEPPAHTTWEDLKQQVPKKSTNYPF